MAALTQEQTDRYNVLDSKPTDQLTAEEMKELNTLQKVNSGEDTDADNKGGDNNPQSFAEREPIAGDKAQDDETVNQDYEGTPRKK